MMRFSLPPGLANSAIVLAALSILALVIRLIGPWRTQLADLETRLREELRKDRLRAEKDRAQCEAELRVARHRGRSSRQMIYALLHLFDVPATKRKEMLTNIRAELAAIEQAEALESGIVATAGIGATEETA